MGTAWWPAVRSDTAFHARRGRARCTYGGARGRGGETPGGKRGGKHHPGAAERAKLLELAASPERKRWSRGGGRPRRVVHDVVCSVRKPRRVCGMYTHKSCDVGVRTLPAAVAVRHVAVRSANAIVLLFSVLPKRSGLPRSDNRGLRALVSSFQRKRCRRHLAIKRIRHCSPIAPMKNACHGKSAEKKSHQNMHRHGTFRC